MKYEPIGQTLMMVRSLASKDFKENLKVKKARRNLLIVLSVQLVLATAYFMMQFISIVEHFKFARQYGYIPMIHGYTNAIIIGCIYMIFYIIYIISTVKYSRTGILVFGWFSLTGFIIGLALFFVKIGLLFAFRRDNIHSSSVFLVLFLLAVGVISIIQILTIKFSFYLAKLIKASKKYQITENWKG